MAVAETPLRGPVAIDPERLVALRARHEVMLAESALRVSRAWELPLLAQQLIGLALVAEAPIDAGDLIRSASLAAGAAALASSPRASDRALGRAVASTHGRTFVVEHERRPVDPMDFFHALCFAVVASDAAALAALARAVPDVDPDLAFAGRGGHERSLYRRAFAVLCAWARDDDAAVAQARQLGEQADASLPTMDDFHADRVRRLLLPLIACCAASDPAPALRAALVAHHDYWSASHRRSDPAGFVAWGPLAAVAMLGAGAASPGATDYLPPALIAVVEAEPVATTLRYEVPLLEARTLGEGLLRVQLSSPGEIVETARRPLDDGRMLVEIEARDVLAVRYRFEVDSVDAPGLGEGLASLLDAGELVYVTERELARLRAAPAGSLAAREASDAGRAAAARALALLGTEDELFRDRMSSPLGRTMCDEQPHKFTREALGALVASFDGATAAS